MSIPSRFSNADSSDAAPARRSVENSFEMPLFPGYIKSSQQKKNLNDKTVSFQDHLNRRGGEPPATEQKVPAQRVHSANDELQQLHTRIVQLEQRHRAEITQLEAEWQQQLETAIALRSGPSTNKPPRLSLHHIPTTYEVPRYLRLTWLDKSLGKVPSFLLLVVAGMALAALSAIALSPTVLWPSVSVVVQAMIPTLFVIGLVSFFVTAAWNITR